MRCSIHGNDLSCPGAHECPGFLHGVPVVVQPAPLVDEPAQPPPSSLDLAVVALVELGENLDVLHDLCGDGDREVNDASKPGHLPSMARADIIAMALSAAHSIAAALRELRAREAALRELRAREVQ